MPHEGLFTQLMGTANIVLLTWLDYRARIPSPPRISGRFPLANPLKPLSLNRRFGAGHIVSN
ncbi:MAG: hypothetical protein JXM69_13245 [Anaerolineae bacterium]|nr:hypothetical protein [Anaerolineae bacterium]